MLRVVYRSYGGENKKGRPEYYSKLLALWSLVRSYQELEPGTAELIFFNDGPIPADRLAVMERFGRVVSQANMGLKGAWRQALRLPAAEGWPPQDLVWFSEDDYLYLPQALPSLVAAAQAFADASYFGLYALIGSRMPNGTVFDDPGRIPAQWRGSDPVSINGQPWRRALSTTSTYGAHVRTVNEDMALTRLAMRSGGAWDHTTCLLYQGYRPYPFTMLFGSLLNLSRQEDPLRRAAVLATRMALNAYQVAFAFRRAPRILVAPDPALITHLETEHLAVGEDWPLVARQTLEWRDATHPGG